ncbi:hypothetical protein J6590_007222 [Homalodisca vitripennis]|nr:hypothetical protein J6590_007222 [Homalodisca vitripennis]
MQSLEREQHSVGLGHSHAAESFVFSDIPLVLHVSRAPILSGRFNIREHPDK